MTTTFTPISALAGGALIGLASAVLLLLNGRIAGISGILGDLLLPHQSEIAWRIAFLLGLIAAPLLYTVVGDKPTTTVTAAPWLLITGGLLVGFGTRLGRGCTSGHGVCGVARASPRSIAATAVFILTGAAVVLVARHLLGV